MKETKFPIIKALCFTSGYWLFLTAFICIIMYNGVNVFDHTELEHISIFAAGNFAMFIGSLVILVYQDNNHKSIKLSVSLIRLGAIAILLFSVMNDERPEIMFWLVGVWITFIITSAIEIYRLYRMVLFQKKESEDGPTKSSS